MICFCVKGVMSRCTAEGWDKQRQCYFSERSSVENRCMYKIEAIDDHCDCQAAQKFVREGLHLDQSPIEEEEELDIDEFLEEEVPALASCTNCIRFKHCHTDPPGFAEPEMEKAASQCTAYRKMADWEKKQLPF